MYREFLPNATVGTGKKSHKPIFFITAILLMRFLGYFGSKTCTNEINWLKIPIRQIFLEINEIRIRQGSSVESIDELFI